MPGSGRNLSFPRRFAIQQTDWQKNSMQLQLRLAVTWLMSRIAIKYSDDPKFAIQTAGRKWFRHEADKNGNKSASGKMKRFKTRC